MYVWEGIIVHLGEADQSLVFWYIPILLIGFFSIGIGLALFIYSYKKIKIEKI